MAIAGVVQKNGIEMEYCKFGSGDKIFARSIRNYDVSDELKKIKCPVSRLSCLLKICNKGTEKWMK